MLLVNPLENKEYFNKSIKTHIALAVRIYLLKDTAGFCLSWWNYWAYLFCLFSYTAFICCIIVITQLESEGGIHGKVSSNHGRHPSSKIICTNWYLNPDDDLMNIFIFPHSALIIILKNTITIIIITLITIITIILIIKTQSALITILKSGSTNSHPSDYLSDPLILESTSAQILSMYCHHHLVFLSWLGLL